MEKIQGLWKKMLGYFLSENVKYVHKDLYLLIRFLTAWDLIYCCFTAVFTEIPLRNPPNAFD